MNKITIMLEGNLAGIKLHCPEKGEDCPVTDCTVRAAGDTCTNRTRIIEGLAQAEEALTNLLRLYNQTGK